MSDTPRTEKAKTTTADFFRLFGKEFCGKHIEFIKQIDGCFVTAAATEELERELAAKKKELAAVASNANDLNEAKNKLKGSLTTLQQVARELAAKVHHHQYMPADAEENERGKYCERCKALTTYNSLPPEVRGNV